MEIKQDPVVERVIAALRGRSVVGQLKYGKTLERKDYGLVDWLQHLQEELMDATLYIEAALASLSAAGEKG